MVPKKEVILLEQLSDLRLKAVLQKHKLVKVVFQARDLKSMKEISGAYTVGGMKLYSLSFGGSCLVIGTYGDKQQTLCFISFHLLYVDLLMQITELKSVTNPKYCDIDSTFGLHDYQITVDIRSSS